MKLSLAMIVKNEADNLGRCLDSVKGLVDEMVIIDTGSTDSTIEIAKRYGARVEKFGWTGNFAEARNVSLSHCSGDWILVLDADEMLNPQEHHLIRQAIQNPEAIGYRLPFYNYLNSGSYFGIGGIAKLNDVAFEPTASFSHYIPGSKLILFRNINNPVYDGRIHEEITHWFDKNGYSSLPLEAIIHHFGKIDEEAELAKQPTYLELAKKDAADRPDDSFAHYNVLQSAMALMEWPTVLESARAYIRLKGAAPMYVYLAGAQALIATERPEEALAFIAPVEELHEEFSPALMVVKAEAQYAMGKVGEAVETCLLAIDARPDYTASFASLSKILDAEGDRENAYRILEAGLDQNPIDAALWEALVGLSAKHKEARVAQDAWHAIQAVPRGGKGIWHLLVAHVMYRQGDAEGAAMVLDFGLEAFPGNFEIDAMKRKVLSGKL
ncbi:MAG: glycosyltransferase [Holophagaceae bacterium]|nr:glycosyltransferase [Holophagaceae bacterium]